MILSYGEALIDMIQQRDGRFLPSPGGSVFNFAFATARQQVASVYANPLSSDTFGRQFARVLADEHVELLLDRPSRLPTSLAIATIDDRGAASYVFHRMGVADRDVLPADLDARWPARVQALHTGCLMLVPDDLARTLEVIAIARRRGAVVSVDANMRMSVVDDARRYADGVLEALGQAGIVKASDEDLVHLGMPAASLEDLDRAAARLFTAGEVQLVALTRGGDGGALYTRSHRVDLPVPAGLRIVDTIGAGDCFHAGLLGYLSHQHLLSPAALPALAPDVMRAALAHAMATAGLTCTRAGCAPPPRAEAEALARRMLAS